MTIQPPNTPTDEGGAAAAAIEPTFQRRVRTGRGIRAEHIRDYGIIVFLVVVDHIVPLN